MNIYQEVYDAVYLYRKEWEQKFNAPVKINGQWMQRAVDDELTEAKWRYVAQQLIAHSSTEVIKTAAEKYPILQQIFKES